MSEAGDIRGMVFDIQRFSIHDGPGIRTTVFLKGCPLRCLWCQNPEGLSPAQQLAYSPDRCIGCGACVAHCPRGAHRTDPGGQRVLDRSRCAVCGLCAQHCHADALEIIGSEMTVTEVLEEVLRDRPFYETSGGGVTLSGGEPMMQFAFTQALLSAAQSAGLHACLETSGFCEASKLEAVREHVDLLLFDLKDTDDASHRRLTGVSNGPILSNLRRLHDAGTRIVLRCPIVPGCNDREDHFAALAALCRELPRIEGVEVMPYHRLGESKHARLDAQARPWSTAPPTPQTVQEWLQRLRELGAPVVNE